MAMEARIRTKEGNKVYRTGLREITNGEDQVWLIYGKEGGGTGGPEVLTGNAETLEGATIEVVKLEGGQSLEEQDNTVKQFAKKSENGR